MTELSDYKRIVEKPHIDQLRSTIAALHEVIERQRVALGEIADAPYTMVNDSESLRHSIKSMQAIARTAYLGRV